MCGLQEDIEHVRAVAVQVKQQGTSVTEQLTATQMQTLQLQVRAYQSCSCPGLRLVCLKSMAGTARGRLCSHVGIYGAHSLELAILAMPDASGRQILRRSAPSCRGSARPVSLAAWVQAAIESTQTTASASHAAMTAALGAVAQEADRCGLLCGSTHVLVVLHAEAKLMLKPGLQAGIRSCLCILAALHACPAYWAGDLLSCLLKPQAGDSKTGSAFAL